jgi:fructose-1,6-bisphosphatase/inositol monophosphatase family enzyme
MDTSISFRLAHAVVTTIRSLLNDPGRYREAAEVTAEKGDDHTAHKIDNIAEDVLLGELRATGFDGTLFSEEAGLVTFGDADSFIVTDPYCNTTLTFRGVRESAVAVYEYSTAGEFRSGAIADVQIPRVLSATAHTPVTMTYLGGDRHDREVRCSGVDNVGDAFLVVSALKQKRRAGLPAALFAAPKLVTTVDGAIVGLRLAAGDIDGFVDGSYGQPSYEVLAYEMASRAGGVVTDARGTPIDFGGIVRGLGRGEVGRHPVVASANRGLHESILPLLHES